MCTQDTGSAVGSFRRQTAGIQYLGVMNLSVTLTHKLINLNFAFRPSGRSASRETKIASLFFSLNPVPIWNQTHCSALPGKQLIMCFSNSGWPGCALCPPAGSTCPCTQCKETVARQGDWHLSFKTPSPFPHTSPSKIG